MTTDEAESRNKGIRQQGLEDLKRLALEMLEMDADQVMWDHVADLAGTASEIQQSLNEVEEE